MGQVLIQNMSRRAARSGKALAELTGLGQIVSRSMHHTDEFRCCLGQLGIYVVKNVAARGADHQRELRAVNNAMKNSGTVCTGCCRLKRDCLPCLSEGGTVNFWHI